MKNHKLLVEQQDDTGSHDKLKPVTFPEEYYKEFTTLQSQVEGIQVQCRLCEVFYPKEHSLLKLHIKTHTNENPYICQFEECNKVLKRFGNLSEHERRTHEKVHSHGCPISEATY